jgi:hypothetical protein
VACKNSASTEFYAPGRGNSLTAHPLLQLQRR